MLFINVRLCARSGNRERGIDEMSATRSNNNEAKKKVKIIKIELKNVSFICMDVNGFLR